MRVFSLIFLILFTPLCLHAQNSKPILKVGKDGLPTGHTTPEGAACDLVRAFIKRDVSLFNGACIKPFGGGENRKKYEAFLKEVTQQIRKESKKAAPSPGGPKSIGKLFAARHLSKSGPTSYGSAVFDFKDIAFVDVGVLLQNGKRALSRTLVIQDADGKWYVHPAPNASPLLSAGLNEESASTQDFTEAYTVKH